MSEVRQQSYHHGNLRSVLIDTTLEMLKTQGWDELSLRALASAAGVSRAAPYAHFEDKGALLKSVAAAGFSRMAEEMRCSMGRSEDVRERFLATGRAYVRFARHNANVFRLMFSAGQISGQGDGASQVSEGPYEIFQAALRAFLENRRVTVLDEQVVRTTAWSCVHGLSLLLIEDRLDQSPEQDERLAEQVTALFADLLGSQRGSESLGPRPVHR
jgi:AcrR family transcriptional regulator